jgi:tripartite-type tricarboxylate transporter receptor subunit TctC
MTLQLTRHQALRLSTPAVATRSLPTFAQNNQPESISITRVGVGPLALLVNASSPLFSVQDLQRLSHGPTGALFFGSPGVGTPPHLACELFKRSAAIGATHVPFSSPPQASNELMAGRLTWVMDGLPLAVPLVKSGRLRALAVTSRSRFGAWPEVPTMAQVGLPDCEFSSWTGLAAPAGT